MLETPHVIVGAAIATKIPNPFISIPLAFASHFLLDMTPHWNPHLNTETKRFGRITSSTAKIIVLDLFISFIGASLIAYNSLPNFDHSVTILLAGFAAILPDVIEGPYFFMGIKTKVIEKWIRFQKSIQNDTNVYLGLFTQAVTIAAAIVWAFMT